MRRNRNTATAPRYYRGTDVSAAIIEQFARDVVERFRPEKIILFGSHACGTPHANSDVDVLVVMETRNELDQSFKIHWTILPPFPLDLIVRTPRSMKWRLEEGDSFLREVVSKGKILYEKADAGVGAKGRSRLRHRTAKQPKRHAPS